MIMPGGNIVLPRTIFTDNAQRSLDPFFIADDFRRPEKSVNALPDNFGN
jgi:hypothetical protein